jgi:RimJ/RimL family protein N-acetyltransferase
MEIDGQNFIREIIDGQEVVRINIVDDEASLIGHLDPVTRSALADDDLIQKLTNWRNMARKYFFTQFTATYDRTRDWLEKVVLSDSTRLLFIIHAKTGAVGQYGFKLLSHDSAELDNLIRGELGGPPRLIYHAEIALVRWLFEMLEIKLILGFVLSDNYSALNLHRAVGFRATEVLPVYKTETDGEIHLVRGEPGSQSPDGLYVQKLELGRSEFM